MKKKKQKNSKELLRIVFLNSIVKNSFKRLLRYATTFFVCRKELALLEDRLFVYVNLLVYF